MKENKPITKEEAYNYYLIFFAVFVVILIVIVAG
jgi:hypothetical protein